MPKRHVMFRELMEWTRWGREMEVPEGESPVGVDKTELALGCLFRVTELLVTVCHRLDRVAAAINQLGRNPPEPPTPNKVREQRERDSRTRAWAVYLRSKGVGSDPESIDPKTRLSDMGFSVRVRKACYRIGVETLEQLLQKTEYDLLIQKNFGPTSMFEVRDKLAKYGLSLPGEKEV